MGIAHPFDPPDLSAMEPETLQGMVEELPAHLVLGPLHIKFNGHEAPMDRSSLEVMHEFLRN